MWNSFAGLIPDIPMRPIWTLSALLVLAAVLPAQADVIVLKRGKPLVGKVWEQGEQEVRYNEYRTGIRRVTLGTERVRTKGVKKVIEDPDPHRHFWRQAAALGEGSADSWVALGREAEKAKLKGLARHAYVEALVRDPEHAEARNELGSGLKKVLAREPRLNPELRAQLEAFLAIESFTERDAMAKEIAALGNRWPRHYLERAWRSAKEKKGRSDDRRLTLRSKEHPGGVYTLHVPRSYDPFRPTPLVFGLHGGGRAGKDGKNVVGSGRSAMNFYQQEAERLGWLVVCPTALAAPWASPANDGFVLAVLDEIACLFNVDLNRVYLVGHSMGGFGTWHFGPKYAHLWAAISPNAGGGRPNLKTLQDTRTGVYCYHGADDGVVGASSDRQTAKQMLSREMDFVYCEIPDSGHGFPGDVRSEMWEFLKVRRLGATSRRTERGRFAVTQEPFSSFMAKPTRDEVAAWGSLTKAASAEEDLEDLLRDLAAGGGRAEKASTELGRFQDAKAAAKVAKILGNRKNPPDARRFAAEALGLMGQKSGIKALHRALLDEELVVQGAAGRALGRLEDPGAAKAFRRGMSVLADRFDKKKTGARMDYTDYEAHLDCATSIVEGIGDTKEPECAPALALALERILLDPIQVRASSRAGHDAARPRRRLASALVAACVALNSGACRPLLEQLISRDDLGVADVAREALARLPE